MGTVFIFNNWLKYIFWWTYKFSTSTIISSASVNIFGYKYLCTHIYCYYFKEFFEWNCWVKDTHSHFWYILSFTNQLPTFVLTDMQCLKVCMSFILYLHCFLLWASAHEMLPEIHSSPVISWPGLVDHAFSMTLLAGPFLQTWGLPC